jgi:hypothetical protein
VRVSAYVLAGDPAWVGRSLRSYYGLVDRIVVSYDRSGRSWAGHPMSVEESLSRISAADPDGKTILLPGNHAYADRPPMETETEQRQAALDAASAGADWVLQIDTDEIVSAPRTITHHLERADQRAAEALAYPLRDIYARTPSGRFLEHCGRFWSTQAAYPGPVGVRAGTTLQAARQPTTSHAYRVDVSARNTDPAHPFDAPVHAVVRPVEAILHLSWVRSEAQMAEKRVVSGYAGNRDWDRDLARWRGRSRHPWVTAAGAPLARDPFGRFRVVDLPELAGEQP